MIIPHLPVLTLGPSDDFFGDVARRFALPYAHLTNKTLGIPNPSGNAERDFKEDLLSCATSVRDQTHKKVNP
jgi:hypothetical protein